MRAIAVGIVFLTSATALHAQEIDQSAGPATIVVTAPGGLADRDEAEGVGSDTIRAAGNPDFLEALGRTLPGVSLQQAQGNPFQPNVVFRGFTASPLQGQAQGLAVYVDGGRFNQPFGDTVQFDLLPEAAIQRADLLDANPVYGLNALGGALVIETKTGRTAPGVFLSAGLGRYGEDEQTAELGWSDGSASLYYAFQRSHDDGWRRHSPSTLYNGFLDFGWDGEEGGVHVKLIGADSDLTGNGSAPVELLDADYRAVFTYPDNTRNRYRRVSVHPWIALGAYTRFEASAYFQNLRQRTLNGDAADIEPCEDEPSLLCLETGEDEGELLRDDTGVPVPDSLGGEGYGVLNRSGTRSDAGGILAQVVDRRELNGGENTLILGFSHDRSRTRFSSGSELGALTEDRSVSGLGPIIEQPDGAITPISLIAHTRYSGLFLSERLPLTGTVTAEVGLRWNKAVVSLDDRLRGDLDGHHHFSRLNPGIQLEWQAAPAVRLRAGYSEANRAPTPAELACADEEAPCSLTNFFVADPPLDQVVTRSYELGGQGGLGKLSWTLGAYRSTNADDIQFVASGVRGRAFFRNVGNTRRQGVEASLAYRSGGLVLRAGYAFTDATFRTPLLLNSPDNPNADENGQIAVDAGDRLPGIPRHRAVLSADYDAGRWTVGGDVQAASSLVLFGDEANLRPRTDGYVVANLRGSVRVAGPLRLFGEVRNVFDRRYATFGAFSETEEIELEEAPGASDPRSLGPGAPRRWFVGLSAAF